MDHESPYKAQIAATFFPAVNSNRARFLTLLAANRIAPDTRRDQAVAMLCERPGDICHPRETLVPSRVQWIVTLRVAVCIATPVLRWLTAWAIQSSALPSGGTKAASNHWRWLGTSPLFGLTAFEPNHYRVSFSVSRLPIYEASERGQGRAALFAARRSVPLRPLRGAYAWQWLWARHLGAHSHDDLSDVSTAHLISNK